MRKLFATMIVLALGFSVAAGAAENQVDAFLGKWKVVMEMRGEEVTSMLSIHVKEDKALAGKWESPRGETKLKDVKVKDNTLTFSRTMHRRDQEITIVSTAKIKDGKLVGTMQTPRGDRPFTGVHAKAKDKDGHGRGDGQRGPEAMMERFDTNEDGKLQEDEAPERMKQFFGMIDQNGDGELDAGELETMRQMREQRRPRN